MASTMSVLAAHPPTSTRIPGPSELKRLSNSQFLAGPHTNPPRTYRRYYKDGTTTFNEFRTKPSPEIPVNKEAFAIDDTASASSASPRQRRPLSSQSPVYRHNSNRRSLGRSQRETFHQGEYDSTSDSSELPDSVEPVNETQSDEIDGEAKQCNSGQESLPPKPKIEDYGAPPLNKIHFSCYQFHRFFVPSDNSKYPLQCMTCLKSDLEIRWRCMFCCLRVCRDCVTGIKKCKDRSLIDFMEKLVQSLESS